MSISVTFHRFDARPLVVASVALIGLVMILPPLPAYAGEKSVFGDVVVERGGYEGEVSTVFGDANVYGPVDGDVHSAFGYVGVGVDAPVRGSVNSGFGDITVRSPVTGDVDAGFGDVYVDSRVEGDIDADHGDINLGPDAKVMGYPRSGSGEVRGDSGAVVTREPVGTGMMPDFEFSGDDGLLGYLGWFFAAAGFAACVMLAAVIAPRSLTAAARRAEEYPGRSLLVGLVSVPAVLLLSVVLAVSVVGVPLLLLMAPAYLAFVFYGALVAAFFVGRKVVLATGRYRSGNALAATVGAGLVAATTLIPIFGELLLFALTMLGTGAAILALISRRGTRRPAYPSYEAFVRDRRDA